MPMRFLDVSTVYQVKGRRNRCKNGKIESGGFTLIELMIASVTLSIGLVSILGSVISMNGQQRYADQEVTTENYMNYLLENLQE